MLQDLNEAGQLLSCNPILSYECCIFIVLQSVSISFIVITMSASPLMEAAVDGGWNYFLFVLKTIM